MNNNIASSNKGKNYEIILSNKESFKSVLREKRN